MVWANYMSPSNSIVIYAIYVYVYMYVYMYIYMYIYIGMCMCIWVYMWMHICTFLRNVILFLTWKKVEYCTVL